MLDQKPSKFFKYSTVWPSWFRSNSAWSIIIAHWKSEIWIGEPWQKWTRLGVAQQPHPFEDSELFMQQSKMMHFCKNWIHFVQSPKVVACFSPALLSLEERCRRFAKFITCKNLPDFSSPPSCKKIRWGFVAVGLTTSTSSCFSSVFA